MDIITNFLIELNDKMDRIAINLTLSHGEEIASITLNRNIEMEELYMLLNRKMHEFNDSYNDQVIFLNSLRFFILKQKNQVDVMMVVMIFVKLEN